MKTSVYKYGITEQKKAELDDLTTEVLDAQSNVEQLTAIVNSLQSKADFYATYLSSSTANRDQALANKDALNDLIHQIKQLLNNSDIAFNESVLADAKIKDLAILLNQVMNKLIYSAELVNKLGVLVTRKKSLNPLISDDLVTMVATAGTDSNNAVALTLVALQSVFAAQAASLEAEAASALEYTEAMKLYEIITGTDHDGKESSNHDKALIHLIDKAYDQAEDKYKEAKKADKEVLEQLSEVKTKLSKAQIHLQSIQAGLAAANAAALAS